MGASVGEQFPKYQGAARRVRDRIAGNEPSASRDAVVSLIDLVLDRAERAQSSGNIIEILAAYVELQEVAAIEAELEPPDQVTGKQE